MDNNMNSRRNRMSTFVGDWPHEWLDARTMAMTGLYYTGPADKVSCQFCEATIEEWNIGDNIVDIHLQRNYYCPLLRWTDTQNKPSGPDSKWLGIFPSAIFCPGYATKAARLASLRGTQSRELCETISSAGFHRSPNGSLRCFFCYGSPRQGIKLEDLPTSWESHKANCEFMQHR